MQLNTYRGGQKLKKLTMLAAAMLALGLLSAVPALGQVSFEVGDSENESGGIET